MIGVESWFRDWREGGEGRFLVAAVVSKWGRLHQQEEGEGWSDQTKRSTLTRHPEMKDKGLEQTKGQRVFVPPFHPADCLAACLGKRRVWGVEKLDCVELPGLL